MPLNETHGYWLAWYWVEFANGTRYWWSYGLNGSKLKIDQPANVTLHYVLGLRELPYVARVWVMPEDAWRVEKGICVYRVENGSIHVGYKEGAPYFLCILMLELPREAGLVAIDLVPDDRRTYSSKVGVVELNGWYLFDVPTRTFRYRGPHSLLLNVTCWLSIWRALTENVTIPSRVLTNEQESNLSRFWEAIDAGLSFRYCPAFWLYDEESRLVDWWYNHRGLSATTLIDLDYYEKTGLLKLAVLPNTGRVGLYIDFGRAVRGWGSGRIAVRGVAP